jgi:hypothetical protein
MKRYILIVANSGLFFEDDSLELIGAMIAFGDRWTVVDRLTGATKNNHKLEIVTSLF